MKITFQLGRAGTLVGESVAVIGNNALLGNWSIDAPFRLQWSDAASAWTGTVDLDIAGGGIEYKYVKFLIGGQHAWEAGVHNRQIVSRGQEATLPANPTGTVVTYEGVTDELTLIDTFRSDEWSPTIIHVVVPATASGPLFTPEEAPVAQSAPAVDPSRPPSPPAPSSSALEQQPEQPQASSSLVAHSPSAFNEAPRGRGSSFASSDGEGGRRQWRCNSCLNCHGMSDAVPDCSCCARGCGPRGGNKNSRDAKAAKAVSPEELTGDEASVEPAQTIDLDHVHPRVRVVQENVPAVPVAAAVSPAGLSTPTKLTSSLDVEMGTAKPPTDDGGRGTASGASSSKFPIPNDGSATTPSKKKGCCVIS